jgi:dTDP-4-dehydrorhamnose reductase
MGREGTLAVLGGSGSLGAQVVLRALARGEERVVSISRDPFAFPVTSDPRLERVRADALDGDAVEAALERLSPGRVILCAALARIDVCEADPERARAINATLPARVASWCASRGARLVHVSTDLVFGGEPPRHGSRYRADDPPAPLSLYGSTKAAGEEAVLRAGAAACVARLPVLFGDSLGRGLGASDALLAAVALGDEPILFEDEWRTPLDVGDAAEALLELSAGSYSGLLHVAGPDRVSRAELGLAVLRCAGYDESSALASVRIGKRADVPPARFDETRKRWIVTGPRPRDVSLDATRARALLGTRLRGIAEALGARQLGG